MRARVTVAAFLVAAIAGSAGGPRSTDAAEPVASLAFTVRPDAVTPHFGTLCSAVVGGPPPTRLAGVGWYREPAWSLDGSRLAFVDGRPLGPVIWSVRADGSGRRRVGGGEAPAWSPDGRRLAFTYGDRLYVVDANGGESRQLADAYAASDAAWSPDARTIAFTSANDGVELALVDVTTGTLRVLEDAHVYGFEYEPSWSPDGRRLAVYGGRILRTSDCAEVGTFGQSFVGHIAVDPAWSPDGTRIAYALAEASSGFFGGGGVYVEELETGARVKVTPDEWERAFLIERDVSWRVAAGKAGTGQPCAVIARVSGEHVRGTTRDDLIIGGPGNDVISGGKGNDFLYGGAGDDALDGGPSTDAIRGAEGSDRLLARDGSLDRISGGYGRDVAFVDRQERAIFDVEVLRRP